MIKTVYVLLGVIAVLIVAKLFLGPNDWHSKCVPGVRLPATLLKDCLKNGRFGSGLGYEEPVR